MKTEKVAKMRIQKKQPKKTKMMLESMTTKSMKMKPRKKESREPRISSKAPKSAQRRLTHNGIQRPLLESQNPYETGENLLRCIREMQIQGHLNHTPCHRSRSGLLQMPRITALTPTKMAPLRLYAG